MPVAVLPVTAVVTRLSHGSADRAVVRHLGGATEAIPLESLPDFVTERHNPANAKRVATVDVELACLSPYRGVRFVDTPGLGSVYVHNTQTSMEWLPRVGAAIVAISIDRPLSEQDLELLRELRRHTPEIALLLTKVDLVALDQRDEIIEFLRGQVAKGLGEELRIFPYSIRPGYEALREDLRLHLRQRLVARRAQEFDEILRYKVRSLIAGCRQYLSLAEQAAVAAEDARAELTRLLAEERRGLASVRNEIWLLAVDLKTRLCDAAAKESQTFRWELLERLLDDLDRQPLLKRGNLLRMTEAYQRWIEGALRRELDPISREGGERLQRFLDEAETSFARLVRAFQDRLSQGIQKALHVSFSGAEFRATVSPPARPNIRTGRTFDVPVELLWFLVPMWIFRPLVTRHFRRLLPWEASKNLYRLAGQWSDAFNRSTDEIARQAEEFIENEMATIERLASGTDHRREAIREALHELEALERAALSPPGTG
jgi:hypothetical protein